MRVSKFAACALAFALLCAIGTQRTEACCGQLVDIYEFSVSPDILDACAGDQALISGLIYEYYWYGELDVYPMLVRIVVTDEWGNVIKTIDAAVTVTTPPTGSDGVDDDGDGLIDEDDVDGIDNDGDGRIDEDPYGYPGDEYADFDFEGAWDCTDDLGEMVPMGTYDLTITASASGMGSATVYAQAVTTSEEPCCIGGSVLKVTPNTINKQRSGKPVTAHVTPPEPYLPADVTGGRVISIDGVEVDIEGWVPGGSEGGVVKFPSADVIEYLPVVPGGPKGHGKPGRIEDVEICIVVDFDDGSPSCGFCDLVDVIDK